MSGPRVTLGITTYNVERYLAEALDSLLAQDYTDFEIVACDNASTDATWDILTAYAGKDDRIRPLRNPENIGQSGNFARVVAETRGELFRFSAHDDLCAPTLLRRCVETLDAAGPSAVLAYPLAMLIDGDGNEIGPLDYEARLAHPSAWRRAARLGRVANFGCNELFGVLRTEVLRRTRLLTPILSNDIMLLAELAIRGRFVQVPERLFYRREHASSTFNAGRDLAEVAGWLNPGHRQAGGFRHARIIVDTTSATLRSELPLGRKLACSAAFGMVYGTRRARVWLGRRRRAVLRRNRR